MRFKFLSVTALSILLTLSAHAQTRACADYGVSETRKQSSRFGSYLVTRLKSKNWIVRINIDYISGGDVKAAEIQKFRERARTCFENIGFVQASNGEGLRIRLTEPGQPSHRLLSPITIKVNRDLSHANSANYYLQASCRTILHETLHLLGLWDEYFEGRKNMSCRSVNDSIMADQNQVFIDRLERIRLLGVKGNQSFRPERKDYFKINAGARFVSVPSLTCSETGKPPSPLSQFSMSYDRDANTFWLFRPKTSPVRIYESTERLFVPEVVIRQDRVSRKVSSLYLGGWIGGYLKLDPTKWTCRFEKPAAHAVVKSGQELLDIELKRRDTIPLRPAHLRKIAFSGCASRTRVYDLCTAEAYLNASPGQQCLKDVYRICQTKHWLD